MRKQRTTAAAVLADMAVPVFTLTAEDPLAAGLIRYWLGAARAKGGYPQAQLRHAEEQLQTFMAYRAARGRKR
jgi:hypothetical protein